MWSSSWRVSAQKNNSTRAGSQFGDEFKSRWLAAYREFGSVSHACAEVQCSRSTIYRLRKDDPKFAENWDAAWEATIDRLEQSAMSRAIDGYEEIVYYKGEECGRRRVFDGRLTEFMLSANRPGKYRSKVIDTATDPENIARDIIEAVGRMDLATGGPSDSGGKAKAVNA